MEKVGRWVGITQVPSEVQSEYLNVQQITGLLKVGNVLIPGTEKLPAFSRTRAVESLDGVLRETPPSDREGLMGLLGFFGKMPLWLIRLVVRLAEAHQYFPGALGVTLRQIRVGLKGVIFSLYYSEWEVRGAIGWKTRVVEGDVE